MMKSELSSLFDDELASEHQSTVVAALCTDADLRAAWHDYQLIGDALRAESHPDPALDLDRDVTARVMAALQREPALFVPRLRTDTATPSHRSSTKQTMLHLVQGGMRYAAALAGVGVVAWLALSAPQTSPQMAPELLARKTAPVVAQVERVTQQPTAAAQATAVASEPAQTGRLQSYLVAHQAYSPGNRFDGGAGYMRTVAASR
ncbi:putative Anti sigma-E protein RseA family protein [Sterolibacterium denitrificans]|uniref:Anti sigma-E protein RseA family protein n=1 Tax=Sterolibacterium denitrificans TaxID=157592 RepID=A0A7Z7MVD9_9PROT|nr:sigma-E factor negative regulatory protein [Sterolibacterium denitrificans]SMB26712.1 putative Anti sigma-E protein RseA family protein [Sterolibacterium denitrificans]